MNRDEISADEQVETQTSNQSLVYQGIEQPTKKHQFLKRSLQSCSALGPNFLHEYVLNCFKGKFSFPRAQIGPIFVPFCPLWTSPELAKALRETSESLLKHQSETGTVPEAKSIIFFDKTTHLEDQNWHVRTPNKPQPPPPVELFFDIAPYTSFCKRPNSPTPQGRRIFGLGAGG